MLRAPVEIPVRAHTRTVLKPDPYGEQADMFGEKPEVRAPEGERLKEAGMKAAAERNAGVLEMARKIAVGIAESHPDRICTSAQVGEYLQARGFELGNYMGSLFRGKHWERTGQMVQSTRAEAHSRLVSVWRLVE